MAKGAPDWNDIHCTNTGAIRDAMIEPDIPFDDAPQRNGLDADYVPPGQTAPNPIKVLSYFEMVSLPSTDWLIEGVVPSRSKSVAFGQSDTFKSFLAADMACSVSTGHTWHGKPVKRCKAIYVANEGAIGVGRKRIPAWMAYHDVSPEDRQNIFLVKAETILPNPVSLANLIAAIRTIVEPGEDFFLIVDVLRGTMSGSESDDEAAHAWTRAAEILIDEGATILTVTHSPYSTDDRARGSSHLWGSFDTRLQVERNKEKRTAVLKVNRHKDHDSGGEWGFQLVQQAVPEHPGETSLVPRFDAEASPKPKRKGKSDPSMGEILKRQYLETYYRLADSVQKTPGYDGNPVIKVSTDAIREEMKSRGFLDKNSKGRGGLTEAARTALSKAKATLINAGELVEANDLIWRP
jgi:AAA domain